MADLVTLNGKVITFDGPDVQAIAIKDGIIAAVRTNAEIRDLAGAARVIDAQGGTVLPGFIDSHVHLCGGGTELNRLNLKNTRGHDALAAAIRPCAALRPDEEVLFASSLEYDAMGDRSATRHDLDQAIPDRPFVDLAADGHTAWANTEALQRAGLFHGRSLPDIAEVVMGTDGLARGELQEPNAFGPVVALTALGGRDQEGYVTGKDPVPAPTSQERTVDKSVLANGLAHCTAHGMTGLHNMDGNIYQLELLDELDGEGQLLCRMEVPMHLKPNDPIDRLSEAAEMQAKYALVRFVKMFMDGVIDSRTAYMLQPYPGTETGGEPPRCETASSLW